MAEEDTVPHISNYMYNCYVQWHTCTQRRHFIEDIDQRACIWSLRQRDMDDSNSPGGPFTSTKPSLEETKEITRERERKKLNEAWLAAE